VDAKEEFMNEKRPPWQPKMDEDQLLNPFAPATQNSQPEEDVELPDLDEAESAESEEAPANAKPGEAPPANR
jgi:hypothetical protein